MTPVRIVACLLFLWVCQPGRADLTLRQSFDVKLGESLPTAAVEVVKKQMASGLPNEIVTRVKGNKVSSTFGVVTTMMDCTSDQITLLNPATKQFVTVAMADYPGNQALPEEMQKVFQ